MPPFYNKCVVIENYYPKHDLRNDNADAGTIRNPSKDVDATDEITLSHCMSNISSFINLNYILNPSISASEQEVPSNDTDHQPLEILLPARPMSELSRPL